MLLDKNQYNSDSDVEFLLERPVGWSSACLDSTINYYLSCNHSSLDSSAEEKTSELKKEDI